MAHWLRFDHTATLLTVGDHNNLELLHNDLPSFEEWQSGDLVIVDGIVTVAVDTLGSLIGVRLLVASEHLGTADLDEDNPQPFDPMVYYSWYVAGGPVVFRLRSKKTVHPEEKLWLQTWKAQGVTSPIVLVGLHLLVVYKH